jgi:hypothetical protein
MNDTLTRPTTKEAALNAVRMLKARDKDGLSWVAARGRFGWLPVLRTHYTDNWALEYATA